MSSLALHPTPNLAPPPTPPIPSLTLTSNSISNLIVASEPLPKREQAPREGPVMANSAPVQLDSAIVE